MQDFPENRRTLRSESLYPSPWKGGWWRIRDAIDYMLTTSTATLDFAAKFKYDLLYNRYQSGRDTIRKYAAEPPYAFFVPEGGRDPEVVPDTGHPVMAGMPPRANVFIGRSPFSRPRKDSKGVLWRSFRARARRSCRDISWVRSFFMTMPPPSTSVTERGAFC